MQYNWALILPYLHLSSEVHLHASAAQIVYCREIVCAELAQGPYTVTRFEPVYSQAERSKKSN